MRYDYLCSCGQVQERDYGFSEKKPAKISCPCGKKASRKIGVPAIVFRGTGWAGHDPMA